MRSADPPIVRIIKNGTKVDIVCEACAVRIAYIPQADAAETRREHIRSKGHRYALRSPASPVNQRESVLV